jgi:hypothetical protein
MLEAHLVRVRNKYCPSAIEEAAESAAAGFQWPEDALHRDADVVSSEGSLLGAIKSKIDSNRASRFNGERVDTMFSGDPEYHTLRDIALNGARMEVEAGSISDTEPPPFREKQLRMPLMVQKHACKLWEKGRGIVIRAEDIPPAERESVAYHSSHWTSKSDDDPQKAAAGRWLLDCKTVNEEFSREAAIRRYGKVELLTLASILASWLAYAAKENVPLSACELSKNDVSSAYQHFEFNPASVMMMSVCVRVGLVFMYLSGMWAAQWRSPSSAGQCCATSTPAPIRPRPCTWTTLSCGH